MQVFQTPEGEAGVDQLAAMEESIQAAVEQMFWQVAKRDSLSFGVGRVVASSSDPDRDLRLDAQRRECDGLVVFHAGKALETALQIIYAKVNNRIRGRDYPGVSSAQMQQDRQTHSLKALYDDILVSVDARPEIRKQLIDEFESIYQTALHKGVVDLVVDGKVVRQVFLGEDAPFREAKMGGGLRHGAEITMDHSSFTQLLTPMQGESDFAQLPYRNFPEFLAKADATYYGRRTMRWSHYSARDHEPGRRYVVVGTRFFARLVRGLVRMGNEQWTWHERFARRWHERHRMIIRDIVQTHIEQNFAGDLPLPDMTPVEEAIKSYRELRSWRTDDYDSLHEKWPIRSQGTR